MKITTCSMSRRVPAVTGELPSRTARTVPRSNIMMMMVKLLSGEGGGRERRGEVRRKKLEKQGKQASSLRAHRPGRIGMNRLDEVADGANFALPTAS
jgi:hypothetical protein